MSTQPRLADHLVERVKALISERKLEAGMRLPAERQLAAKWVCRAHQFGKLFKS